MKISQYGKANLAFAFRYDVAGFSLLIVCNVNPHNRFSAGSLNKMQSYGIMVLLFIVTFSSPHSLKSNAS